MGSKSKKPAARLGDLASNHGPWPPTPIIGGSGDVLINGRPAARQGDPALLHAIPNNPPHGRSIAEGSSSVLINGKPAARVSDAISCGGDVAIGSGNVFIGDSPKLLEVEPLNLPKLNTPPLTLNRPSNPKSDNSQTSTKDEQPEFATEEVTYPTQNDSNNTDAHIEPPPLVSQKSSAAQHWQAKKDAADNFPEYFAAHLMGLNAETGYSIAEGIANTYETVTDPQKFKQAMVDTAQSLADAASDPKGTYEAIKQSAVDFANLSSAEQADIAYKTAMGMLAGGGVAGKGIGALGKAKKSKTKDKKAKQDEERNQEQRQKDLDKKFKNPQSFAEAELMLQQSRQKIIDNGGVSDKYSQEELLMLANKGEINDNYIVRIISEKYLHKDGNQLEGYLGVNTQGKIKYWSTTFDQIEGDDTDPRAINQRVGIPYDPEDSYVMILIDREQITQSKGSYALLPNYDNMSNFAKQELAAKLPHPELIDETLTPKMSERFFQDYQTMQSIDKDGAWDEDVQKDYFKANNFSEHEQKLFKNRLELYNQAGANEHYLGNGLTKNLNDTNGDKPHGVVETFSYDKNPNTFKEMLAGDNPTVSIVKLKPINGLDL